MSGVAERNLTRKHAVSYVDDADEYLERMLALIEGPVIDMEPAAAIEPGRLLAIKAIGR
jgi:hypothetical protein